jgi:hypothetical protein
MLSSFATTAVFVFTILSTTKALPNPKTRSTGATISSPNQWTWIPVPGTMCSDGSVTGFAINTSPGSTDLVINWEEGGICYDYQSCYVDDKAYNIGHSYNATTFADEGRAATLNSYSVTARFTSDNPFYQANMAWIPYCTGDLHAGMASPVYSPNTAPTNHHGFINGNLMMQAIKAALPATQRVWMTGSSAGGFGAIYQYPNAINVFGSGSRIDIISDSAIAANNAYWYPSLNIQLVSKTVCPKCDYTKFDSFLGGYAAVRPNSRFAALSFSSDNVLPSYENTTTSALTVEILTSMTQLSMSRNAKGFIAQGTGHVVFGSPQTPNILGGSLSSFITKMVNSAVWTGY